MADNVNNYCLYVANHKVIGQPCVPEWVSHDSTTDERVILPFAWRSVPTGFKDFLLVLRHYRREGADSTVWRLYCSRTPYLGDVAFDTAALSNDYTSCSITTSTGYLQRGTSTLGIIRGVVGADRDICWLVLTAQNGDASTRAALTSIDLWPHTPTTDQ